jgi:hypothetical protein
MPGTPLAGEDGLPAAVSKVATLVGFLDRGAEVGGGVVPPAPVVAVRPQREVQRPFRRVLRRARQFDHLGGPDALGVDGLQPGQGFLAPRLGLVVVGGARRCGAMCGRRISCAMGKAVSAMLSRSLPCSGGMTRKVRVTGVRRVLNSGQRGWNSFSRSRIRSLG